MKAGCHEIGRESLYQMAILLMYSQGHWLNSMKKNPLFKY
jgi:hypothetical protein